MNNNKTINSYNNQKNNNLNYDFRFFNLYLNIFIP
jgi:hypothetical protein